MGNKLIDNYEVMEESISKNIRELSEFFVDNFRITNFYDMLEYVIHLHNFKARVIKRDKELAKEIVRELKNKGNK